MTIKKHDLVKQVHTGSGSLYINDTPIQGNYTLQSAIKDAKTDILDGVSMIYADCSTSKYRDMETVINAVFDKLLEMPEV